MRKRPKSIRPRKDRPAGLRCDGPTAACIRRKDEKTGISCVNNQLGKEAKLKYKVIKRIGNFCLVDIELITGRHHQIRVQFSSRGNPILGDALYDKKYDGNLYLHAYSLSFNHPVTKERLEFNLNPTGGKWNEFFER